MYKKRKGGVKKLNHLNWLDKYTQPQKSKGNIEKENLVGKFFFTQEVEDGGGFCVVQISENSEVTIQLKVPRSKSLQKKKNEVKAN